MKLFFDLDREFGLRVTTRWKVLRFETLLIGVLGCRKTRGIQILLAVFKERQQQKKKIDSNSIFFLIDLALRIC